MDNLVPVTEEQLQALTHNERGALERWLNRNLPPLAPNLAERFFDAYIQGNNCEQIHKLNPGVYLGAIVHAKIIGKWDERYRSYLTELYSGVRQRLAQAKMESVNFSADMLAAVHKLNGEKIKKFLITGNPDDLVGVSMLPNSFKSYKDLWEAIGKITGDGAPVPAAQTPQPPTLDAEQVGTTNTAHDEIKRLLANKDK